MDSSTLNVFITTIEPGKQRPGPLSGLRFATKDLIATAGVRTTAGSLILKDWVPKRSAPIVRALESLGAVNVGKTNTHEFAFGTTNDNPHYGATKNPWNPTLTTGGSSGGSAAAVAAGVVSLALGTDTAGSVRIPAALCGCVGFKPGYGILSARGVIPLAPTLDTVGFLAKDVGEAVRAFGAITGRTGGPTDRRTGGLRGVRIGVIEPHAFGYVETEIVTAIEEALRLLEKKGARIVRMGGDLFDTVVKIGTTLGRSEAIRYHRRWYPARRAEYGADLVTSLDLALEIPPGAYRDSLAKRRAVEEGARRALEQVDLLAGPTVAMTAFPNRVAYEKVAPGGEMPRFVLTRLTYPFSLARLPAISLPCGLSSRRLPIGLQLAAGKGRERFLLGVAAQYEAARGSFPAPPVFVER